MYLKIRSKVAFFHDLFFSTLNICQHFISKLFFFYPQAHTLYLFKNGSDEEENQIPARMTTARTKRVFMLGSLVWSPICALLFLCENSVFYIKVNRSTSRIGHLRNHEYGTQRPRYSSKHNPNHAQFLPQNRSNLDTNVK